MVRDPEQVPDADYIVVESTYGDRSHNGDVATDVLGDTIIIPTFAVGRAQSILYD